MASESRERRQRYGAELKAQIMAECEAPGASVARVAMAHLHAPSYTAYDLAWGDDLTELWVRYGIPVAYSRHWPAPSIPPMASCMSPASGSGGPMPGN